MAAVESTELVTITINEVELQVPKGELIVESVKRLGLEIPIFCYHPRMKPVGMCRMCLVEVGFKQPDGSVRKMPKPQAGCTLPASEGMVIFTDTEPVHRDRKGVLEFLLINHPLDCPICDRGGECPLQNNTIFYGPSTSRFVDMKRHAHKAFPLSDYVTLDLERCIQCGRCVRFTEEISGDAQLAFRFRGADMQPSTFKLTDFESKFSGNVIEICPVGALTSSKYRFRARPWDLETRAGLCLGCGNGCNVWMDHRAGKLVRVNGRINEEVNEEWTCDRGKFGHDFYNDPSRLTQPLLRQGNAFVPISWADAYAKIAENFTASSAGLIGSTISNEGLYMFQRLFREGFKSSNIDHRWTRFVPPAGQRLQDRHQSTIAGLEAKATLLVVGTNLSESQPIVFLRVRKAWFSRGAKVVTINSGPADTDSFAHSRMFCKPGGLDESVAALRALVEGRAEHAERGARLAGLSLEDLQATVELLKGGDFAVITSNSIYETNRPIETLADLQAICAALGGEFNCFVEGGNDEGAVELGVVPDAGPGGKPLSQAGLNTHEIFRDCISGEVDALWVVGDPFRRHPNRRLVEDAIESVPFLVYQGVQTAEVMEYASLILPMEAPAEHDGTYTNVEGRVQRMQQVVANPGDGKPAWRIFNEMFVRLEPSRPFFNASEIMDAIAREVPAFREASYAQLAPEGTPLKPVIEDFAM
ncbi:MAG: NADH-quinone oxidoreductase subunit NuoG [Chthonomonas sp.]|nr:NADH-quinone oxidoreductase subunit NuoG [Chthonomonas sp.]